MLSALLLLSPGASAQQTVCATGFIMDTFCIQPGTLLDNNAARSLIDGEGPQKHSYHCLLDVPQCLDGGFEIAAAFALAALSAAAFSATSFS